MFSFFSVVSTCHSTGTVGHVTQNNNHAGTGRPPASPAHASPPLPLNILLYRRTMRRRQCRIYHHLDLFHHRWLAVYYSTTSQNKSGCTTGTLYIQYTTYCRKKRQQRHKTIHLSLSLLTHITVHISVTVLKLYSNFHLLNYCTCPLMS